MGCPVAFTNIPPAVLSFIVMTRVNLVMTFIAITLEVAQPRATLRNILGKRGTWVMQLQANIPAAVFSLIVVPLS